MTATPEGGVAAAEQLDCPNDDLVYTEWQGTYGTDVPAGFKSPEAAIAAFLIPDDSHVSFNVFDQVAETNTAAQFVEERTGSRRATIFVKDLGKGWFVSSFSACNSYLVSLKGQG